MTASTQAAPRQMSFGRFPTALAMLALGVVIAVAVAIVALNAPKATAPAASTGFGHGPGDWYYATAPAVTYGQSVTGAPYNDHGMSRINEPGQVVTGAPFNDHGSSGINEPLRTLEAPTYRGPYLNHGVFAVPPASSTGKTFNGVMPYAGPFYYEGSTPVAPNAVPSIGSGALGYPPFGASSSAKTIDSPYVAPRPRNQ